MNKPLTMIIEETKKSIFDAINNAGVHPVIIRDLILKDIYSELNRFTEETVKKENELYYKNLENKTKKLEKESTEE